MVTKYFIAIFVIMKLISTTYLKGLLKNISTNTDKKMLNNWIARDGDMIKMSDKEYVMLGLIKRGGLKPESFHKKN